MFSKAWNGLHSDLHPWHDSEYLAEFVTDGPADSCHFGMELAMFAVVGLLMVLTIGIIFGIVIVMLG